MFGLGGCVVEARFYEKKVSKPWRELRDRVFNGSTSLHASKLRNPSKQQLTALSYYFEKQEFRRIAAVVTDKTEFVNGVRPYQAVALCLVERLRKVSADLKFDEIYLLVEESSRGNKLAEQFLSNHPFPKPINGKNVDIPFKYYFVPKSINEPGLEVADFIMHATGTRTKIKLVTNQIPQRKDFSVTFPKKRRELYSYLEIDRIEKHS